MNIKAFAGGAVAALSLAAAGAASANVITLTFEGIGDEQPIGNYYNGGGGPNYGIQFGSSALALVSAVDGGTGNFNGSPPPGDTIAFFLSGPGDVMDVAAGFTTGFSFFYVSPFDTGAVTVWSGLDGTGTLLATLNLPATPSGGPGCVEPYCPFEPFGVTFSGTAESAIFTGVANEIGFDNITLGSASPGGVPEPATWALMLIGVGGLGTALRSRRGPAPAAAA